MGVGGPSVPRRPALLGRFFEEATHAHLLVVAPLDEEGMPVDHQARGLLAFLAAQDEVLPGTVTVISIVSHAGHERTRADSPHRI